MSPSMKGAAISVAGIGLAAGAVAFASLVGQRKGRSPDDAPEYTSRHASGSLDFVGRTVTIRKYRAELFAYWRKFENLAAFMENLERVTRKEGDGHAVWTIKAPAGRTVDVETEIVEEIENELIAWRSVEGSDIVTQGRVTFEDAPGERGTRVGLTIAHQPPAGELGRVVAKLFLREPEIQARHDLKRFKMLMETGEIATSAMRNDETRKAVYQEKVA
jgi:uncharacterized membrane protein